MKATNAQARARTEEILSIVLDGAQWVDIRAFVSDQEQKEDSPWKSDRPISDAQLRRYVAAADKLLSESCKLSRRRLLRRHLAQRRSLYAKAVSQGDVKAALAVLNSEASLLHLDEQRSKPSKSSKSATPGADAPQMTMTDVTASLAGQMRAIEAGTLPQDQKARLVAQLADSYLRAATAEQLEARVQAIEAALAARNEKPGGSSK